MIMKLKNHPKFMSFIFRHFFFRSTSKRYLMMFNTKISP